MIEHVYRRASRVRGLKRVVVLTDDERVAAGGRGFRRRVADDAGGLQERHRPHRRRRPRWAAAAVVNIQGDEPLIDPAAIEALVDHLRQHPSDPVVTLAAPAEPADLADPDTVKVVVDRRGYALYFSRAAIPFPRRPGAAPLRKHLGIYGYRRAALVELAGLEPSRRWSSAKPWSSCGRWRTASPSASSRPPAPRPGSTPRRTSKGSAS